MAKKSITAIVATIVDELNSLTPDERQRVISASLTLLGDAPTTATKSNALESQESTEEVGQLPARARTWMRQNGLSLEQLHELFHISPNGAEIIASGIPGKKKRDQVRNTYVLLGVAHLLSSGEVNFDDKAARALCEKYGCYDHTNHMKYMKGGNEFTGSKDRGWTLTAPGLKHGALLIAELTKN